MLANPEQVRTIVEIVPPGSRDVNSGHERPQYAEPDAAYPKRLRETPTHEHTGTGAARAIAAQDARTSTEDAAAPSTFEHELTATQGQTRNMGPAASDVPLPGQSGGPR